MRTYKLTIAYDGTAYQGWQRQANTENTLQGTLERTISSVAGYPVEIDGSCLLYTSDAADEEDSVDLGGRGIIKKKNKTQ